MDINGNKGLLLKLLCISAFLQMFLSYYDLFGISPRSYFLLFFMYIVTITFFLKRNIVLVTHYYQKKVISILLSFLAITIIINILSNLSLSRFIQLYVNAYLFGFIILILMLYILSTEMKLKKFVFFLISLGTVNAIIGLLQYFNIDFAWQLRESLGYANLSSIEADVLSRYRIVGMSLFTIPFSYQLLSIIPLNFALLFYKGITKLEKTFLLSSFIICTSGLVLSFTRSALIALLLSILTVILFTKKNKILHVSLYLLLLIISMIIIYPFLQETRIFDMDNSAYSRIPLYFMGLLYFLENPLGNGANAYSSTNIDVQSIVGGMKGSDQALSIGSAHNQFMNIAIYYGFVGLIIALYFYFTICKLLIYVKNHSMSPLIKYISIGLFGSFVGYIINSLFHNDSPFLGDVFNFYFIGLTICILNVPIYKKKDKLMEDS